MKKAGRISSGIPGLDEVLGGGFPDGTVTLFSGGPGSGKTLCGLSFLLAGASAGERCCFLSLGETREGILRACDGIKPLSDVRRFEGKNLAVEHVVMGEDIDLDYFAKIFASYPQVDRLVVDNLNRLLIFAENRREYRMRLSELVRYLRERVSCSLLLCETVGGEIDSGNGEAFECDGVVHSSFLEFEEKPKRILSVQKMRYSSFEPKIPHELVIGSGGIKLTKSKII
jgi:circadian clock protein KaiC